MINDPNVDYPDGVPDDVWITKTGTIVRLEDMENTHLLNVVRYMNRAINRAKDEESAAWSVYGWLQGEEASYCAESAIDSILDAITHMERKRDVFLEEVYKRGLWPRGQDR